MNRLTLLAMALLFFGSAASAAQKPAGKAAPKSVLPFLEDDYPRALKEARARGVPIFVDAWAPW